MIVESMSRDASGASVAEAFGGGTMVFGGNVTLSPTIPTFIPADQAYYWSIHWQASERKALADIEANRTRIFADPTDAVRYLLGDPE
jgi:hypothetical protein